MPTGHSGTINNYEAALRSQYVLANSRLCYSDKMWVGGYNSCYVLTRFFVKGLQMLRYRSMATRTTLYTLPVSDICIILSSNKLCVHRKLRFFNIIS